MVPSGSLISGMRVEVSVKVYDPEDALRDAAQHSVVIEILDASKTAIRV